MLVVQSKQGRPDKTASSAMFVQACVACNFCRLFRTFTLCQG